MMDDRITPHLTPMNAHQLLAEQYKMSQQQYFDNVALVEAGYELMMKAEQESMQRLQEEYERKQEIIAKLRADQIAALKEQYAIVDD